MASLVALLIWLFLVCTNIPAESTDPSGVFCNTDTNISSSSQAAANINGLLPVLVKGTQLNGFIATSYGKPAADGHQLVYGLAQCRADVGSQDCSVCIHDAAKEIRRRCPDQADARIWYEYCFLRYSTEDFIGDVDTGFGVIYYNVENVTDPDAFNKELGALAEQISSQAAKLPASKGLGKGKAKLSPFLTLYALVQCTRDLTPINCAQCLAIAVGNFPGICADKKGCRVLYSSCYVRYELYPFYFSVDSPANLADSASQGYYNSVVFYKP